MPPLRRTLQKIAARILGEPVSQPSNRQSAVQERQKVSSLQRAQFFTAYEFFSQFDEQQLIHPVLKHRAGQSEDIYYREGIYAPLREISDKTPAVSSARRARRNALLTLPRVVESAEPGDANADQQAEFVRFAMTEYCQNIDYAQEKLADDHYFGFALVEPKWSEIGRGEWAGLWAPHKFFHVHQENCAFDLMGQPYFREHTGNRFVPFLPGNYVMSVYGGDGNNPLGHPEGADIFFTAMFLGMIRSSWALVTKTYGNPIIVVQPSDGGTITDVDKDQILANMDNLQGGPVLVNQKGLTIFALPVDHNQSAESFARFEGQCLADIDRGLLGLSEILDTDGESTGSEKFQGQGRQGVNPLILERDALRQQRAWQRQYVNWLCAVNFPVPRPPKLMWRQADNISIQMWLQIFRTAYELGVPLKWGQIREKCLLEKPDPDDPEDRIQKLEGMQSITANTGPLPGGDIIDVSPEELLGMSAAELSQFVRQPGSRRQENAQTRGSTPVKGVIR